MPRVPKTVAEAKLLLRSIPDGSEIGLRFTLAMEPEKKNEAPFIRMSLLYIGVVAGHDGHNLKVNVTQAADFDTPGVKPSKISKKITVTPEDLLQQYPKIPPKYLILFVKPPEDESNNNSNSNSNSNSEGGRRRKTRKSKKQSKKTRTRK